MDRYKYIKKLNKKRVVFLTGTRADFGKLKSLINILNNDRGFETHVFATGMHMLSKYGYTINELEKENIPNLYKYINHSGNSSMESIMASTLIGFGNYIQEFKPDLVVVHGDRVEALAGALAAGFKNIPVAHIEGGETSGTIDEHLRHAISKISHIHFVANQGARKRLIQMGERPEDIFVIGSPDIDVMLSGKLPSLNSAKKRYDIKFDKYAVLIYHPVTTEINSIQDQVFALIQAAIDSNMNYIVIHPNNDPGTDVIKNAYDNKLSGNPKFKFFPSIRFEYFLTFLKNTHFIIGNSSSAIREAPYYGVPAINIGTRQNNRAKTAQKCLFNCNPDQEKILTSIKRFSDEKIRFKPIKIFGRGNSDKNFLKMLKSPKIWTKEIQKQFQDLRLV